MPRNGSGVKMRSRYDTTGFSAAKSMAGAIIVFTILGTVRQGSGRTLNPFESAFFVYPNVGDNQNGKKNTHLNQPKHSQRAELDRPGKQENCLHVEDHKQNGDNVETHRVASAGIRFRFDAAFVGA